MMYLRCSIVVFVMLNSLLAMAAPKVKGLKNFSSASGSSEERSSHLTLRTISEEDREDSKAPVTSYLIDIGWISPEAITRPSAGCVQTSNGLSPLSTQLTNQLQSAVSKGSPSREGLERDREQLWNEAGWVSTSNLPRKVYLSQGSYSVFLAMRDFKDRTFKIEAVHELIQELELFKFSGLAKELVYFYAELPYSSTVSTKRLLERLAPVIEKMGMFDSSRIDISAQEK